MLLFQGGVDSKETTAAYILIALTEGDMYGPNTKDNVSRLTLLSLVKHVPVVYLGETCRAPFPVVQNLNLKQIMVR